MSFLRSTLTQSLRAPMRLAVAQRSAVRAIATSPLRFAEHHQPLIQGEGAKDGTVASDEDQSTGIERFELMGRLQGVDVFDMTPLPADRLGTIEDPIVVPSMAAEQVIGCTGHPAESHVTMWMKLTKDIKHHRCPHCGSVYQLEHLGMDNDH